jgi:lactoylglutathione lyase
MSLNPPEAAKPNQQAAADSLQALYLSISLTVKDLQKSLEWYHGVLGFSVDRKMEREGKLRAVALKAGEARISINQDDGAKGWDRIKGLGFSMQLSTKQSVDEIAARIKQHGGTLLSEPADMPWGVRMLRLEDPDGYKLSISMPLAR